MATGGNDGRCGNRNTAEPPIHLFSFMPETSNADCSGGEDVNRTANHHLCHGRYRQEDSIADCPMCRVYNEMFQSLGYSGSKRRQTVTQARQELKNEDEELRRESFLDRERRRGDRNLMKLEELTYQTDSQQIHALPRRLSDGKFYMRVYLDPHNTTKTDIYSRRPIDYKMIFLFDSFKDLHPAPRLSELYTELHPDPKISTAVSLVIAEGDMDVLLNWPYNERIIFTFLDLNNHNHVRKPFNPDSSHPGFQQPLGGSTGNDPVFLFTVTYNEIQHCLYRDDCSGSEYVYICIEVEQPGI